MATPPQLTPEQRTAALAKAAEARAARAEIKARLKMGSLTLAQALASDDSNVGKLKVVSLLESLPGVGKVKARRVMDEIGIADNRRVQGLGAQQRAALLDQLGS
jgi:DNA uptake protein ComE-like DNA-binding protein